MDICHGDRAQISDVSFDNIFVEYTGEENIFVVQEKRDDVYSSFDEEYIPPIFVIAVGVAMWSIDDYAGDMKNVRISNINIHTESELTPEIEIYRREDNVKIENLQIHNIKMNNKAFEPPIIEK